MLFAAIILTSSSFFGFTTAVDTANGVRAGRCPSPGEVWKISRSLRNECHVDTDCTGNPNQKCCHDNLVFGYDHCVNPIPACRDGTRIDERDFLPEGTSCDDDDNRFTFTRFVCEEGPAGEGGWGAAYCWKFYRRQNWWKLSWGQKRSKKLRPTCRSGADPLEDSEGKIIWCTPSCPHGSSCQADRIYSICCPAVCTPGEYYSMPDNPCTYCMCGNTGQPSYYEYDCKEMKCDIVNCPEGQWARNISGTCCDYECVPNPVCTPGKYYTLPDNLCKDCICGDDGQPSEDCREIMCPPIYCPPGKTIRFIEGRCCGQECVDPDVCILPIASGPCESDMPSWGYNSTSERCEQFVYGGCQGNDNRFETEEACIGKCDRSECDRIDCAVPTCADGTEVHVVPDSCCPVYNCVEADNPWTKDGKLSYVVIMAFLLGVLIIGSILTLVFCYLYKKKHTVRDPRTNQYYDNLKYSHVEIKKKVLQDSLYIVKLGDTTDEKEKESLQAA